MDKLHALVRVASVAGAMGVGATGQAQSGTLGALHNLEFLELDCCNLEMCGVACS